MHYVRQNTVVPGKSLEFLSQENIMASFVFQRSNSGGWRRDQNFPISVAQITHRRKASGWNPSQVCSSSSLELRLSHQGLSSLIVTCSPVSFLPSPCLLVKHIPLVALSYCWNSGVSLQHVSCDFLYHIRTYTDNYKLIWLIQTNYQKNLSWNASLLIKALYRRGFTDMYLCPCHIHSAVTVLHFCPPDPQTSFSFP